MSRVSVELVNSEVKLKVEGVQVLKASGSSYKSCQNTNQKKDRFPVKKPAFQVL